MVDTTHEIRMLLKNPEQLQESDILRVLGNSSTSLPVLYERLQDYLEADFPLEFLVVRLRYLVEQGVLFLWEERGVSFYKREEENSCMERQKPQCMFPNPSFKFMWGELW